MKIISTTIESYLNIFYSLQIYSILKNKSSFFEIKELGNNYLKSKKNTASKRSSISIKFDIEVV